MIVVQETFETEYEVLHIAMYQGDGLVKQVVERLQAVL